MGMGQELRDFASAFSAARGHALTPAQREEQDLRLKILRLQAGEAPDIAAYNKRIRDQKIKDLDAADQAEKDLENYPVAPMGPIPPMGKPPGPGSSAAPASGTSGAVGSAGDDRLNGGRANTYVAPVTGIFAPTGGNVFLAERKSAPGRLHSGVDIRAVNGSPVVAAIGGKVMWAGKSTSSYKWEVVVLGDDGNVYRYAPHGGINVQVGQQLGAGDQLGVIGDGHLHLEVIPPGSGAYNKLASGQITETQTYRGGPQRTVDPASYFGVEPGTALIAGKPLNADPSMSVADTGNANANAYADEQQPIGMQHGGVVPPRRSMFDLASLGLAEPQTPEEEDLVSQIMDQISGGGGTDTELGGGGGDQLGGGAASIDRLLAEGEISSGESRYRPGETAGLDPTTVVRAGAEVLAGGRANRGAGSQPWETRETGDRTGIPIPYNPLTGDRSGIPSYNPLSGDRTGTPFYNPLAGPKTGAPPTTETQVPEPPMRPAGPETRTTGGPGEGGTIGGGGKSNAYRWGLPGAPPVGATGEELRAAAYGSRGTASASFPPGKGGGAGGGRGGANVPIPRTRPPGPETRTRTSAGPGEGGTIRGGKGLGRLSDGDRQALFKAAESLGANPQDLLAVIGYETVGTYNPDITSPTGYKGLIQFGKNEQKDKRIGFKPGMSFADQVQGPVVAYLKQRGFKPGMGLAEMYGIINAGSLDNHGRPRWGAADVNGSLRQHMQRIYRNYMPSAITWIGQGSGASTARPSGPGSGGSSPSSVVARGTTWVREPHSTIAPVRPKPLATRMRTSVNPLGNPVLTMGIPFRGFHMQHGGVVPPVPRGATGEELRAQAYERANPTRTPEPAPAPAADDQQPITLESNVPPDSDSLAMGHEAVRVGAEANLAEADREGPIGTPGGGLIGGDSGDTLSGGEGTDYAAGGGGADTGGADTGDTGDETAIPTPGSEESPQASLPKLAPAGKLDPDVGHSIRVIERSVDPDGTMPESQRHLLAIGRTYQYYMARGDAAGAQRAAQTYVYYYQQVFNQWSAIAEEALHNGQFDDALLAGLKAFNAIPDGHDMDVQRMEDGSYRVEYKDANGSVQHSQLYTPQQIGAAILNMTPSTFYRAIYSAAGGSMPSESFDAAKEAIDAGGDDKAISTAISKVSDPKEAKWLTDYLKTHQEISRSKTSQAVSEQDLADKKAAAKQRDDQSKVGTAALKRYDESGGKVLPTASELANMNGDTRSVFGDIIKKSGDAQQQHIFEAVLAGIANGQPATPEQMSALTDSQRAYVDGAQKDLAKTAGTARGQGDLRLIQEGIDKTGEIDMTIYRRLSPEDQRTADGMLAARGTAATQKREAGAAAATAARPTVKPTGGEGAAGTPEQTIGPLIDAAVQKVDAALPTHPEGKKLYDDVQVQNMKFIAQHVANFNADFVTPEQAADFVFQYTQGAPFTVQPENPDPNNPKADADPRNPNVVLVDPNGMRLRIPVAYARQLQAIRGAVAGYTQAANAAPPAAPSPPTPAGARRPVPGEGDIGTGAPGPYTPPPVEAPAMPGGPLINWPAVPDTVPPPPAPSRTPPSWFTAPPR